MANNIIGCVKNTSSPPPLLPPLLYVAVAVVALIATAVVPPPIVDVTVIDTVLGACVVGIAHVLVYWLLQLFYRMLQ